MNRKPMIGENWQTILVLICVAGALYVLVRRTMRLFGGAANAGSCGTGDCGSCNDEKPSVHSHQTDGFVRLESLTSTESPVAGLHSSSKDSSR